MVSFVRFIMAAFLRTLLIIVYCLLFLTIAVIAGATLPRPASHQGHYDSNNGFTTIAEVCIFPNYPSHVSSLKPCFKGNVGETSERRGGVYMYFSECICTTLR